MVAMNIAQRYWRVESRGVDGARDAADFLFTGPYLTACRRRLFAVDYEPGKIFIDVDAGANPFDDFLTQIAALVEAHSVSQTGFQYEIVFGNVGAIAGNTCFDSQDLVSLCADPPGRVRLGDFVQLERHAFNVGERNYQIE